MENNNMTVSFYIMSAPGKNKHPPNIHLSPVPI